MQIEENSFPKWMYSADEAKVFQTSQEVELAGDGWYESPADVPAKPVAEELVLVENEGVIQFAKPAKKGKKAE